MALKAVPKALAELEIANMHYLLQVKYAKKNMFSGPFLAWYIYFLSKSRKHYGKLGSIALELDWLFLKKAKGSRSFGDGGTLFIIIKEQAAQA